MATEHGKENEIIGPGFVQAQEFEVAHRGLVVCPEEPWLAASPGGIVDDRAAGNEVSSDQLTCPIPA